MPYAKSPIHSGLYGKPETSEFDKWYQKPVCASVKTMPDGKKIPLVKPHKRWEKKRKSQYLPNHVMPSNTGSVAKKRHVSKPAFVDDASRQNGVLPSYFQPNANELRQDEKQRTRKRERVEKSLYPEYE